MTVQVQIQHDNFELPKVDNPIYKVHIKSYGCQMNVYDAVRMQELLAPFGYEHTDEYTDADLIILNTCHIREKADEKVFSDLGRMFKSNRKVRKKDPLIAVGGCVGQAQGKRIMQRAPQVKIVFGPQTYHRLPEYIAKVQRKQKRVVNIDLPKLEKFDALPAQKPQGGTAFLTIQEGCDKFCAFCVVPYTRGAEISRPAKDVLKEAQDLVAQGVKEVTLLGQNVNAYHGVDANNVELDFAELIRRLAQVEGLERIRFTTSHPNNTTAELIDLFRTEPKLMPYFHLPVQSGSNRILQAMNRNHTIEEYMDIVRKLKEIRPDIAMSSDFIVGFPGETEEDFEDTLAVVAEVGYHSAYSFAYSPRPGTPAAALTNQVDEVVKKERLAMLQALITAKQEEYNSQFMGQTLPVLVETEAKEEGQLRGRSPHNVPVNFSGNKRLIGEVVNVKIIEVRPNSLVGEIELID